MFLGVDQMMKPCLREQNLTSLSLRICSQNASIGFLLVFYSRSRAETVALGPIVLEICDWQDSSNLCSVTCCQGLCYHIHSCPWRARDLSVKIHCPGTTQTVLPYVSFIMLECPYRYLLLSKHLSEIRPYMDRFSKSGVWSCLNL